MSRYKTNQRHAILEFLMQNGEKHISVDQVELFLRSSGHNVGKATIYRYFEILQSEGRLRKYDCCHGKGACYQFVNEPAGCSAHFHFMCDKCHRLYHIDCSLLKQVDEHVFSSHGFQINGQKTTFHGLCASCSHVV